MLAALGFAGCASTISYVRTERPCQEDAMRIVWRDVYHRQDAPPSVWWVPRDAQNCGKPLADGSRGFLAPSGACVEGLSWAEGMDLVWYGSWPRTALAHEAAHVIQTRAGMPRDNAHVSAPFQPGGAVDQAYAALDKARLCQ